MQGVFTTEPTVLLQLDSARIVLLVLHGGIVPAPALDTGHGDDLSHCYTLPRLLCPSTPS